MSPDEVHFFNLNWLVFKKCHNTLFRYILEVSQIDMSEVHKIEEEELILKKVDVVNRRDYLLTQVNLVLSQT